MPGKSVKVNRKEYAMSKHDTFRSFQDLDAAQFRKAGDAPRHAAPPGKRTTAAPAIADESAMFREAVAGTLDVSLKHTPDDADTPAPRVRGKQYRPAASPTGLAGAPSPPRPESVAPEPAPQADTDLFAKAMDGVTPIRAAGREIALPKKYPVSSYARELTDMEGVFSGKLEFSLEYTDEFVQGHVLGLAPAVLAKLKAGAYSPEGHVDLHGQNMEQAYATLTAFIRHAYQSGKRHLIVVTGRGKNSPGGMPVLRERVQTWLTRDPFKRVVLGFCSAQPGDGGTGALYLLLRKRKKSQGKIIWNHIPSEEELLL